MNDWNTFVFIDIQAQYEDRIEILQCVKDTLGLIPGWSVLLNVDCAPKEARFFSFNFQSKYFSYHRSNDTYSDTMDSDEVVIKDLADISYLLEFIYQNCESMLESHVTSKTQGTNVWYDYDEAGSVGSKPLISKEFISKLMGKWSEISEEDVVSDNWDVSIPSSGKSLYYSEMVAKYKAKKLYSYCHGEPNGTETYPPITVASGDKVKFPPTTKIKMNVDWKDATHEWKIKTTPEGLEYKSNEDILDAHDSYAATMAAAQMISIQDAYWSGE